jgi:putative ABC transport system permease protein
MNDWLRQYRFWPALHDGRIALRGFRRTPTFTVAAVLILGLGIGMAAAVATVFDTVLVQRLPVRGQDRVVVLRTLDAGGIDISFRVEEVDEIRRQSRMVRDVAAFWHLGAFAFSLNDDGRPFEILQAWVTANFFDMLGARPALGRLLRPEDDATGAPTVMVLSYGTWQRRFGRDPRVLGKRLVDPIRGVAYTVVGVAEPGLDFPSQAGAWLAPIPPQYASVNVMARLAPNATPEQARSEFLAVMQRIDRQRKTPVGVARADVRSLPQVVLGDVRPILLALAAAVALLLLITCANVGNLMLLRAAAREHEMAIRRALGATRGDIARQLGVESVLMGGAGSLLGLGTAYFLLRALVVYAPTQLPRSDVIRLAALPVAGAVGVALLAVIVFGVLPALGTSREMVGSAQRLDRRSGSETRERRRVREYLVAAQVALALVMLASAGLLVRSLERLERQDLGYRADHLGIGFMLLSRDAYSSLAKAMAVFDAAYPRLRAVPGVAAVSPLLIPPFLGPNTWELWLDIDGRMSADSSEIPHFAVEAGGGDLFRTMGISILRGRAFTDDDRENAPKVAILSESAARRLWPGENPIGKRIRDKYGSWYAGGSEWKTVVGVAEDTHFRALRESTPMLYLPWRQFETQGTFAVRTHRSLESVLPAMRRALREIDPSLDIWQARTMDDYLAAPLSQPRMSTLLMSGFGVTALLLAAIGLYGVMASTVRQRTRELGVRMALGATPERLRRGVLGRSLGIVVAGAVAGLGGALATGQLLTGLLYQVSPVDPITLVGVCVLLFAVALVAAYVPAQRATRVDPAEALRSE